VPESLELPPELTAILSDSLTERGIAQWLDARNRVLNDRRPRDLLADGTDKSLEAVLRAARSFVAGDYV